ncbi:hypothetical protein Efla_002331 [Eimeria flavescens]
MRPPAFQPVANAKRSRGLWAGAFSLWAPPYVSFAAAACLLLLLGTPPRVSSAPPPQAAPQGPFKGNSGEAQLRGAPHAGRSMQGGPWWMHGAAPLSSSLWGGLSQQPAAVPLLCTGLKEEGEALGLPSSLQGLISVSFVCLFGCLVSFLFQSASHLSNYYEPKLQRMVCRISCALPLFALLSTAACFFIFSELRALQEEWGPLHEAGGTKTAGPPPLPSAAGSSPPGAPPLAAAAEATGTDASAAAAAAGQEGPVAPSVGGPPAEAPGGPWLGGPSVRELSAATEGEEAEGFESSLSPPEGLSSRVAAEPFSASSSGGPPRGPGLLGGGPRERGEGPAGGAQSPNPRGRQQKQEAHHNRYRRPYYLQQQLFFELGKQLTQSTALYSFSALMINACGGYRCLSLTLGCDGHVVPYLFPFSLFLSPFLPTPRALRFLKLGVMQFVLVLPLWTAATLMADTSTGQESDSLYEPIPRLVETIPRREETIPREEDGNEFRRGRRDSDGDSIILPSLRGARPQLLETYGASTQGVTPAEAIPGETIPVEETILEEDDGGGDSTWVTRELVVKGVLGLILSVSMFASMMSLSQFYLITRPYLSPYKPENKFFLIQLLVFTNSWQRLAVGLVGNLGGLPGVGDPAGIGLDQGIDLYHNLLTNIWAFALSLLLFRSFPVSDHLPETDDEAVSYLEAPRKPSALHAFLDVCFSVDLIADAHEAVLAPQLSLDRAFSLLQQQTLHHQAFFQELTETEEMQQAERGGGPLRQQSAATTTSAEEGGPPLDFARPLPGSELQQQGDTHSERGASWQLRRGDSRMTTETRLSHRPPPGGAHDGQRQQQQHQPELSNSGGSSSSTGRGRYNRQLPQQASERGGAGPASSACLSHLPLQHRPDCCLGDCLGRRSSCVSALRVIAIKAARCCVCYPQHGQRQQHASPFSTFSPRSCSPTLGLGGPSGGAPEEGNRQGQGPLAAPAAQEGCFLRPPQPAVCCQRERGAPEQTLHAKRDAWGAD